MLQTLTRGHEMFDLNMKSNSSDAVSEWAGWNLAHPEFGVSFNPIPTRGQIMFTTLLLVHADLKT